MKLFFSVGEPSGDLHGANLIRELRRQAGSVECVGYGGPLMKQAGCELQEDLTRLAIMWFTRVLLHLPYFWRLYRRAGRYFAQHRPDAVVLIDYPGFNWWIARAARRQGIPVIYYGAPQLWAWGGWRVAKMRRLIDHVLCKLPFEETWYRQRGVAATYIGHPYFDQLASQHLDEEFVRQIRAAGPLVTILPGSRTQEVAGQLTELLRAVALVSRRFPRAQFAVASYNESQGKLARDIVRHSGVPVEVYVGRTQELIRASHCCLACSGSVSLELMYHARPTVILYRVGRLFYWLAQRLVRVRYITLVNLLASAQPFRSDRRVYDPQAADAEPIPFPEYPTCEDRSQQLAAHLEEWLGDPAAYDRRVLALEQLRDRYGHPGASARAAGRILEIAAQAGGERSRVAA